MIVPQRCYRLEANESILSLHKVKGTFNPLCPWGTSCPPKSWMQALRAQGERHHHPMVILPGAEVKALGAGTMPAL